MSGPASLSLGEVEALALRAARGAGLSWGLAEDAAFATRWMCAQGLDGPGLLLQQLDLTHARGGDAAPRVADGDWAPDRPGGSLGALTTGAALCDHFALADGPLSRPVRLRALECPALLAPLLARAASGAGVELALEWPDCRMLLAGGALVAGADAPGLAAPFAALVTVTVRGRAAPAPLNSASWQTVPWKTAPQTLDRLLSHAARTYVPASATSRRDAGSATPEDD